MLQKLNFITNLSFEFWLQSVAQKIKNKTHLRKRYLNVQEWHLTLGVPTSKTTHVGREKERTYLQNNIKAKPKQLKLSKTDPLMWS
jgi:hypothetical protein